MTSQPTVACLPDRTDLDMQKQRQLVLQYDTARGAMRVQGYVNDAALSDKDRAFGLKMLVMEAYRFQRSARTTNGNHERHLQRHHPAHYDLLLRGQTAVQDVFQDIDLLMDVLPPPPNESPVPPPLPNESPVPPPPPNESQAEVNAKRDAAFSRTVMAIWGIELFR